MHTPGEKLFIDYAGQRLSDWIGSHARALDFFGGVTAMQVQTI